MSRATVELPAATRAFLTRPHTATLTTLRPDGTPHVVPMGVVIDTDPDPGRSVRRSGNRRR